MSWGRARKKPIEIIYREVEPKKILKIKYPGKIEVWGEVLDTGHKESIVFAYIGEDFIIKDEAGEYPIKKEIFYKTYDVLHEPTPKTEGES